MTINFREAKKAIFEVAKKKVASGDMSAVQYVRLSTAFVVFPRKTKAMVDGFVQLMEEVPDLFPSAVDVNGEVDWDQLLAFFEKLLPLILEFVEAFLKIIDE